jgi:hypothetical protein
MQSSQPVHCTDGTLEGNALSSVWTCYFEGIVPTREVATDVTLIINHPLGPCERR